MLIQDLHSHTYYSNCGRDEPEKVVQAAIDGGIELLGITDHNYGIGARKREYFEEMCALRDRFAPQIKILPAIEIATIGGKCIGDDEDITWAEYCLVEHIDQPESCVGPDIVSFANRCGIKTGIAHTDIFAMLEREGEDPLKYFRHLAENGVFWEMNVNYDSIHKYREHEYVKRFCEDEDQQRIIRESGIEISVGFDGHRVEDYLPERVKNMCRFLEKLKIRMPFA